MRNITLQEMAPRFSDSTYRLMFKLRDSEKIEWMQTIRYDIAHHVMRYMWSKKLKDILDF